MGKTGDMITLPGHSRHCQLYRTANRVKLIDDHGMSFHGMSICGICGCHIIMRARRAKLDRKTSETAVSVTVRIDGAGKATADTGVKFLDHLIVSFGKHAMMDITVRARSNDGIAHHLVEDAAITIGMAIDKALGDRGGIARFGHASVPMDESLAEASVDLVRRPYQKLDMPLGRSRIEDVSREDLEHFFQSLIQNINGCIHIAVKYGQNDHHKAEAAIKSLAVAFRGASAPDGRSRGAPSTKGSM